MFVSNKIKTVQNLRGDTVFLCAAAFFMAFSVGVFAMIMPFIIEVIGGSDADMGLCLALGFAGYVCGCLVIGPLTDRFNVKSVVVFGAVARIIACSALLAAFVIARRGGGYFNPVAVVTIIVVISSLLMAMFWAPVMGWLSSGHEGGKLTRRLAVFNMSSSIGLVISQYIGGVLAEINYALPLIGIIVSALVASVIVSAAKKPKPIEASATDCPALSATEEISPLLPKFRAMARAALVTTFVCIGLARSQLAMLFTDLNFSESDYGTAMALMCLLGTLVFWVTSKTHRWHYKVWAFMLAQLISGLSMLMIIQGSTLGIFFLAVGLLGLGNSFVYSSNQFYTVSGSLKRSGPMAVHEILLSVGHITGFVAGGYLAESFGRDASPYWFGFGVVAVGILVQAVIWFVVPAKKVQPA